MFLGTPHRGSAAAGWGEIVARLSRLVMQDTNKRLISTLDLDSETLNRIHEDFKDLIMSSQVKIHSFQEARGILIAGGKTLKVGLMFCL
jgi:hypothetical protein